MIHWTSANFCFHRVIWLKGIRELRVVPRTTFFVLNFLLPCKILFFTLFVIIFEFYFFNSNLFRICKFDFLVSLVSVKFNFFFPTNFFQIFYFYRKKLNRAKIEHLTDRVELKRASLALMAMRSLRIWCASGRVIAVLDCGSRKILCELPPFDFSVKTNGSDRFYLMLLFYYSQPKRLLFSSKKKTIITNGNASFFHLPFQITTACNKKSH